MNLKTPEENLAFDEALLDQCEATEGEEVLRFWEPDAFFVVLGYANKVASEVNVPFCEKSRVPVLRRCSGGGTVLQGPGCLNYSLILRIESHPPLASITGANSHILSRNAHALSELLHRTVTQHGHTDLAIEGLKICGNAQRRKRNYLLFHGCILLHLDFTMVESCLRMPSLQPEYRRNRSHSEFLLNLGISPQKIIDALSRAWNSTEGKAEVPPESLRFLVENRYGCRDWNFSR